MNRHIILSDLRNGIGNRLLLLLPVPVFAFLTALSHMKTAEAFASQGSFLSAVLAVFEGIKVIDAPSDFAFISPFFILLYSWPVFITANYAYDDMKEYGIQTFTRCRQKNSWWISKCIWNICMVLLYYGMIYFACFLAAAISGKISFSVEEIIWNGIFLAEKDIPSGTTFLLYLFILPVVTAIALSLMQMFLSIVFFPIAGAGANILLMLVSISCLSQWLPGNYLMFLRMSIRLEQGIQFFPAFLTDLALAAVAVCGGAVILKKKDIF
jgi:hypothetical protein